MKAAMTLPMKPGELAASLMSGWLMIACFTAALPAFSQPLDEEAIRKLVSGNTVTGTSTHGRPFSEFHQGDGRLFGNNGYYTNTDACWTTRPSAICYYYGEGQTRTVHCFTVEKDGAGFKLTLAPPSPRAGTLDATAWIEPGNPHRFGDDGRGWICDGLISRVAPSSPARIATRR